MTDFVIEKFYDEYTGRDAWHVKKYGTPVALVWDENLAYKIRKILIEADHG